MFVFPHMAYEASNISQKPERDWMVGDIVQLHGDVAGTPNVCRVGQCLVEMEEVGL
jgi:hypothetical protein